MPAVLSIFSSFRASPPPPTPVDASKEILDGRDVIWRRSPDSLNFDRHYPRRALDLGVQGRAVIEGIICSDGRLGSCVVVAEAPPDQGFGQATLRAVAGLRVRPENRAGQTLVGARLRVPVTWRTC